MKTRGRVSEVFRAQSLRPDVLAAHLDVYLSIMFGHGGLPRKERETIAVLVSSINECRYCVVHHSAALAKYGVIHAGIGDLVGGADQKNKQMLRYAEKLTKEPGSVVKADVRALRQSGFSDEEIPQINLVTSYFNFVNRIVSGLGVKLEAAGGEGYRY